MTAACPACIIDMTATPEIAQSNRNVVLSVPKLHCAGCIRSVEDILNAVPGVREARVNLSLRRAIVSTDLPPEALIEALAKKAGFEAFVLDQAALGPQADPAGQDLILRLGVAGFAMMNVMLLSVAVWSGASDATRDLFHLISAAIALPATIYAARPFFESARKALGNRRLNMDVPISLAILLACGMSLYESLEGGAQTYFDAALSLTFFLLIGRVLEHRTRAAAQSAARELAALEVHKAQRKRGRQVEEVSASELSIGDVVIV
ncbi:MAG: heavy metal translocating P-type ATPase, partial [Pseudomonadota bacterium]